MVDVRAVVRRVPPPEPPLRDELLSIERLEERAHSLAARFTVAPPYTVSGAVTAAFRLLVPPLIVSGTDTAWLKLTFAPDTLVGPAKSQGMFAAIVPVPVRNTWPLPVKLVPALNA